MEKRDIFLCKKHIEQIGNVPSAIGVYVALRRLMNKNDKKYYVNVRLLVFQMCGYINTKDYIGNGIKAGLKHLIDIGLVIVDKEITSFEYVLDLSECFFENEYFIKIYDEELHQIMNATERVDKYSVLYCFIQIVGTFNNKAELTDFRTNEQRKGFYGNQSQEFLAEMCGIKRKNITTFKRYIQFLEEKHLLYVYKHRTFRGEYGTFTSFNNHYGRYSDLRFIRLQAEIYEQRRGIKPDRECQKEKIANEKRSCAAKYNQLCNGKGEHYTVTDITEIRDYVIAYNEDIEDEIINLQASDKNKTDVARMVYELKKSLKNLQMVETILDLKESEALGVNMEALTVDEIKSVAMADIEKTVQETIKNESKEIRQQLTPFALQNLAEKICRENKGMESMQLKRKLVELLPDQKHNECFEAIDVALRHERLFDKDDLMFPPDWHDEEDWREKEEIPNWWDEEGMCS